MNTLDHRQHLKSLDGLRGIAFLMVYFDHLYPGLNADPLSHIRGVGWLGVDLFFVLSGFLITGILYDTLTQPHYFRNFFARRALRLFPIYIVVVALAVTMTVLGGGHFTLWAVPYFLYAGNIVLDLGKTTGIGSNVDVSHFWSLAIEEQFYLLWPVALFFARTKRRVLLLSGLGIVLAIGLRWLSIGRPSFFLGSPYLELPMRMDTLLAGAVLAMLMRSPRGVRWLTPARLNTGILLGTLTLMTCVVASHSVTAGTPPMYRFGFFASAALFFSLVALSIRPGSWVHRLGDVPLLRTFGRYSYGLYLLHFFFSPEIIPLYHALQGWPDLKHGTPLLEGHLLAILICLIYLAVLLGVAALSYHLLELPMLRLKKYFAYSDEQRAHHMQTDQDTVVSVTPS